MLFNLVSFIIFFLSQFFTWGANGHRVVAQVCENHLSEKAKTSIKAILDKEYLAEITNWSDYIKSEREWKFADEWHYTTVHPDQNVTNVRDQYAEDPKINDAIEAIELMKQILKGDSKAKKQFENIIEKNKARKLNNSTEATALAFLVHIIGDIHQPLHVGKNRDSGGNKIAVLFFSDKTNVHSVWDTKIIEHERLSYTEFTHFIDKMTNDEIIAAQNSTLDDWARESVVLREHIYNTLYDYTDRETGLPSFSWNYQHDNIVIVEERLVLAGVRLAGVLNSIFE
jgi:hypothetical protein